MSCPLCVLKVLLFIATHEWYRIVRSRSERKTFIDASSDDFESQLITTTEAVRTRRVARNYWTEKKKLDKAQNFIALRQDNELACFTMLTLKQLALRFCDLIWWCNWCAIGCTRLRIQLIMSNGNTSPICLSTFYFRQSCQRESCGLISCRSELKINRIGNILSAL